MTQKQKEMLEAGAVVAVGLLLLWYFWPSNQSVLPIPDAGNWLGYPGGMGGGSGLTINYPPAGNINFPGGPNVDQRFPAIPVYGPGADTFFSPSPGGGAGGGCGCCVGNAVSGDAVATSDQLATVYANLVPTYPGYYTFDPTGGPGSELPLTVATAGEGIVPPQFSAWSADWFTSQRAAEAFGNTPQWMLANLGVMAPIGAA